MTRTDIQCRLEAYLALRQSLGFVIMLPDLCFERFA